MFFYLITDAERKTEANGSSETKVCFPDSSDAKELITSSKSECDIKAQGDGVHVTNGEVNAIDNSSDAPNNVTSSSNLVQENGDVSKKGIVKFACFILRFLFCASFSCG